MPKRLQASASLYASLRASDGMANSEVLGAAGGGANMYFEIRSVGTVPGNGIATTHSQYRQTIRN